MRKIKIILSVLVLCCIKSVVFAYIDESNIKVEVIIKPRVISASTDFYLIPKDLQKAVIYISVIKGNKTEILKNLKLEIIADPFAFKLYEKKGSLLKEKSNKWIYIPAKELKSEKNPNKMKIKIIAKCNGKVCSKPQAITVRPVFDHLVGMHTDTPEGNFHSPYESDYNLAWKYARWKYDINTSNLNRIVFDSDLKMKGATYAGIFSGERLCKLGKKAFINENICASVLGHENVHGGQDLLMFIARREKAEPPAYQWEIQNARRLGLPASYVHELKSWRNAYSEQDRGFKLRILPWF